jgi:hypothetical protein
MPGDAGVLVQKFVVVRIPKNSDIAYEPVFVSA